MIDVFTLTRERLEFTQYCFKVLQEKAGSSFRHWILDNGSQDGTIEWLKTYRLMYPNVQEPLQLSENVGIAKGLNLLHNRIAQLKDSEYVIKFDNDCEVMSLNIIGLMLRMYKTRGKYSGVMCYSPRVEGLNKQPPRMRQERHNGHVVGITNIVGGIFRMLPFHVYKDFRADETLPKAYGVDGQFAQWFGDQGGTFGYIEDLTVNHYLSTNGQAIRYPEYFERKRQEEER